MVHDCHEVHDSRFFYSIFIVRSLGVAFFGRTEISTKWLRDFSKLFLPEFDDPKYIQRLIFFNFCRSCVCLIHLLSLLARRGKFRLRPLQLVDSAQVGPRLSMYSSYKPFGHRYASTASLRSAICYAGPTACGGCAPRPPCVGAVRLRTPRHPLRFASRLARRRQGVLTNNYIKLLRKFIT